MEKETKPIVIRIICYLLCCSPLISLSFLPIRRDFAGMYAKLGVELSNPLRLILFAPEWIFVLIAVIPTLIALAMQSHPDEKQGRGAIRFAVIFTVAICVAYFFLSAYIHIPIFSMR